MRFLRISFATRASGDDKEEKEVCRAIDAHFRRAADCREFRTYNSAGVQFRARAVSDSSSQFSAS